jgi:hypothetical protein
MASTLPTGGELTSAFVRDHLYNFDTECFIDKLATASQNGCAAAYSTRLLRSNYYGPMVRVRRSTDNVEQDFYGDVFGKLGTRIYASGRSLTSWLGGATGHVVILYDQSGNVRNVTQTTNANQPTITATDITYSGNQWLQVTNTQIPSAAMTANSSGGLVASASSELGVGWQAWNAFDLNSATGWHSAALPDYNTSTGIYIGNVSTTDINSVVHRGEWLQLQLASAVKLNSFSMTPRVGNQTTRSPRDFVILGSNNGTSWNVVHQEFNRTNWTTATQTFTVTSPVASYSYYRIVVKRIGNLDSGMGNADSVQIMELVINPTTVPLVAGDDTYTYYATWTPTANNNVLNICEQNTSSVTNHRRAALTVIAMRYGFIGESNDAPIVPLSLNVKRRTVMMCNHTLATGNMEIYDEGVLYKGTSGGSPANLNVGGDIFVIGRCATKVGEFFIGPINEIIVTNNTALEREALLYFTPTLLTKPRELFPKPKKMLTFAPLTDNSTPINMGAIANLNLDLINVSNATAVSDWNGYAQGTAGNRPMYFDRGGYTNDMGYLNFDRANSQHLNGGSRTLNIATNGGLTIVALVKFTGTAGSWERIIDFGNGSENDNIVFARFETSSTLACDLRNGGAVLAAARATNTIVQDEWAVFSVRYTHSNRLVELFKNNVFLTSVTASTTLTDRTLSNCYIGRSNWADTYLSGQMAGVYVFDRSLSYNEMTTLANSLMTYSLPNIPRHITEISNVNTENMILTVPARTGWAASFNQLSGNYIDFMDVPNTPMSFCFWFYQTTNTYSTIVGLTDYSRAGNGIQIDYPTATNRMTIFAALPTAWSTINIENVLINTWYHVVVTTNTNFQVQVYLNGVYQNQVTGTALIPSRSRFIIGASGDGGRGYGGLIQDFRVYDYVLRSDDITKLYNDTSLHQNSLQVASNYLVNRRNWYSVMQRGHNGASFTGAFTITSDGSDPNVQYQLLNSTTTVNNYIYHYQRIQDYKSFTCSFELYIGSGTGDQMYFFAGASSLPVWDNTHNNCNLVNFQVYNANGNARPGVNIYRIGTNVSQSHYTQYINASRWVSVSITYNRGASEATWVVNMNGQDLITYTDTNNEAWRSASGNYWGIGGWTGGAVMTAYIRRVELTYVPQASSILNRGLIMNSLKRFPEGALSANSSLNCIASASSTLANGFHQAFKAFDYSAAASGDTASSTMYHSAWSTYNSTTGAYIGGVSTTVSGVSYSGEWLQIQLPRAIKLFNYVISCRPSYVSSQSPNTWVIAGSNDGATWTLLDTETNVSAWDSLRLSFNVNNSGAYTYFRMICTVTGQTAGSDRQAFVVSEWELYSVPFTGVKYPIAAMTSDTTTFAGTALGCGTYRTTYSSTWSDNLYHGWKAFTNEADDAFHISNDGVGAGVGGGLYRGTNGAYTGTVSTTISGSNILGEWLQIELPHPIRLTRYSLLSRRTNPNQSASTWRIAGSNDSNTWTEVDSESGITGWVADVAKTFIATNATVAYKYYRMVTTNIQNASDWHWAQREWMLFDDTTTSLNLYNKTPGLVEGFTWKLYDGWISSVNLDNLHYYNIGRCIDTSNSNRIFNGEFITAGGAHINYATEIFGYFRANVTGTWSFRLWGNDVGYFWLGANALSGFTTANANMSANLATGTTSIYLVEGVYYPIRIRHSQQTGFNDLQFYFTPPSGSESSDGAGYYFSSIGTNQAYPAESAKVIKDISQTNIDGVYYINVNGVSTATYCLMNDIYDGGGWMMLMKATTGTTFNYNSDYWRRINTLNPSETNRNNGDAKFDAFNHMPIKDVMAIWPDISSTAYTNVYGKNGGSLLIDDGWAWKIDNWNLFTPVIQQYSTAAQNALRGAYALYKTRTTYTGATIKLRRYGDNVEQDFFANLSGNLGTILNAGGTSVMSWIGGMPLNVINSNNWYSLMTRAGTAQAVAGTDPYVQSQVATGALNSGGNWSYSSVPISTYANLFFDAQVYWNGSGDNYDIFFGDTSANGGQGIRIMFMFWSGYSNNGFSGAGIYLLKNGVALTKSNTSPNGAGANTWFNIQVIYNKSTTNTWQVNINGASALTYSDSSVVSWAASAGNYFSINAYSGGGLQINVWYRQLNLWANFAYVTTWYDQSGNSFHATQTTNANQPILTGDSTGKFLIDSQNTGTQFLNMSTTGPIPTGSSNFTLLLRHGSLNTNRGALIGGGVNGTNNQSNVLRGGDEAGVGYWNYWWFNDLGIGTNSRPAGNTVAVTWDGTTRRGYVVGNGGSSMTTVTNSNTNTGINVATGQQYLFRSPYGEYLNGQLYHVYIYNIALGTGDLSVLTNSQNYATTTYASNATVPQRITALEGFQLSRDAHPSNPYVFNGFSTGIFSSQGGAFRNVFGGGYHVFGYTPPYKLSRWGLLFNNEGDFWSNDTGGGIGMDYSAGDLWTCCGTVGINRSARIEMYGR